MSENINESAIRVLDDSEISAVSGGGLLNEVVSACEAFKKGITAGYQEAMKLFS